MLVGDSRQATEEQLKLLRREENDIINEIAENNDRTIGDKLRRLAENIEKRIEYLDPLLKNFTISDISTYITRSLKSTSPPCKIAPWVSEYLPDKYKDATMSQRAKLANRIMCSVTPSRPLVDLSIDELEFCIETKQGLKNDHDKAITQINGEIEDLFREGLRRGYTQLAGEKIRDQISARDYRFEIPDDAELDELFAESIKQLERVIHEMDVFTHDNYPEYRTPEKDRERQHGNSARVWANALAIVNEKKWSGDMDFWFDRNYWKNAQSSHKAGNSTMFPTTLCARCSENVKEDPKDFHVVRYDNTSPTGYRCDNCGGTKILTRENSREQVGDKSQEVERMASEIMNHAVHYVDIFKDWVDRTKNPAVYARKLAISQEFSKAAFGKEKKVIPRQKTK